jgi:hypothetical protein
LYFLKSVALIILGVVLATVCYLVADRERQPAKPAKSEPSITTEESKEDRNAVNFFLSIMIGLVGGFVTATLTQMVKGLFQNPLSKLEVTYWAIMFAIASSLFFQLAKLAMKRFGVQRGLRAFDAVGVICIALGIFTIIVVNLIL